MPPRSWALKTCSIKPRMRALFPSTDMESPPCTPGMAGPRRSEAPRGDAPRRVASGAPDDAPVGGGGGYFEQHQGEGLAQGEELSAHSVTSSLAFTTQSVRSGRSSARRSRDSLVGVRIALWPVCQLWMLTCQAKRCSKGGHPRYPKCRRRRLGAWRDGWSRVLPRAAARSVAD